MQEGVGGGLMSGQGTQGIALQQTCSSLLPGARFGGDAGPHAGHGGHGVFAETARGTQVVQAQMRHVQQPAGQPQASQGAKFSLAEVMHLAANMKLNQSLDPIGAEASSLQPATMKRRAIPEAPTAANGSNSLAYALAAQFELSKASQPMYQGPRSAPAQNQMTAADMPVQAMRSNPSLLMALLGMPNGQQASELSGLGVNRWGGIPSAPDPASNQWDALHMGQPIPAPVTAPAALGQLQMLQLLQESAGSAAQLQMHDTSYSSMAAAALMGQAQHQLSPTSAYNSVSGLSDLSLIGQALPLGGNSHPGYLNLNTQGLQPARVRLPNTAADLVWAQRAAATAALLEQQQQQQQVAALNSAALGCDDLAGSAALSAALQQGLLQQGYGRAPAHNHNLEALLSASSALAASGYAAPQLAGHSQLGGVGGVVAAGGDGVPAAPSKPRSQHKLYKTELCRNWLLGRNCRYGAKCQFAHGQWELQPKPAWPTPPPEKEGEGQEGAAEEEAGLDGCAASVSEDGAASMVAAVPAGRESAFTAPGGAMSRQGSASLLHSDISTALSAPADTPAASAAAHLAGYQSMPTSADRLMGGSIDSEYFLGHTPSMDLMPAPLSAPMSATMVAVGGAAPRARTVMQL